MQLADRFEILLRGSFSAERGHILRIETVFFYRPTFVDAPEIENLTTGYQARYGRPLGTIPLVTFTPAVLAYVESMRTEGASTHVFARLSKAEAFLSYSHLDKGLAGQVQTELRKAGVQSFLAHEDIEPSEQWRKEIRQHLDSCILFVPIITLNYLSSAWANQETGYAISGGKIVIPLIIDSNGMKGLVEEIQGIPASASSLGSAVSDLVRRARATKPDLFGPA